MILHTMNVYQANCATAAEYSVIGDHLSCLQMLFKKGNVAGNETNLGNIKYIPPV
jgi:hypothetical protein